jgi:hypothetical protein
MFAKNLLDTLQAREYKIKLMHTLNTFRSIQRRLTFDLREFGTRDRVVGDADYIKPEQKQCAETEERMGNKR